MALWNGTTLNTNALSSNINKWFSNNAIPMVVKRNAFLYALKNKETGPYGMAGSRIKTAKMVNGNALNVRLMGKMPTFTGLADANQTDALSISWVTDAFGAANFAWSHFYHPEPIVMSELKLIRGDEARTNGWLDDIMMKVTRGWEATLGDAINGTNTAARTTIAGWRWGSSDGVSTGETAYATYGTLDRSDSGNVDFRGNVRYLTGGDLKLDDFVALKTDILADNGNPDFSVVGQTGFLKLEQEIRGSVQIPNKDWDAYRGDKMFSHGIAICFESRCGTTELGMFDSEALTLFLDEDGVNSSGLKDAAAIYKGVEYILPVHVWSQFVVTNPSNTGKITNIIT